METLDDVSIDDARALIVDATAGKGTNIVVTVHEAHPASEILCLVDDPSDARYLRYAGAETVLSPKHRLGKSLADKARNIISIDFDESLTLGEELNIVEVPVHRDSDLCGKSLSEYQILEQTGVKLLGAWIGGEFVTSLSEDEFIDENTVLVFAGTSSQLEDVLEQTYSHVHRSGNEPVIIVGHGFVGMTMDGILTKAGFRTTIVDRDADEHVDVRGDVTEEDTLHEAGIEDAQTVIIALSDDDDAVRATLVVRVLNPEVDILVVATTGEVTNQLYSAGAGYVLALPNVSSRMVALNLFDEGSMTLGEQIRVVHMDALGLVGSTPEEAHVRDETNCVVVAIERNGDLLTNGETVEIQEEDRVIVAGTEDAIDMFDEIFGE